MGDLWFLMRSWTMRCRFFSVCEGEVADSVRQRVPAMRTWGRAAGALFVVALVVLPSVASSAPGGDPSAERAKVRARKAEVASDVNALKATDAQLDRALADLEANVAGQQARLAEAERAAQQAEAAHAAAIAAVQQKEGEISALREDVRRFAVEAFVHPPGDDALAAMDTEDPSDAAERRALLELQNNSDADLLDRLDAAHEDLEVARGQAEQTSERAKAKRGEVASRLAELRSAREQKAAFATQVESRLEARLAEAESLSALDAQLSQQIREAELARARRVASASGGGSGRSSGGGGGGGGGGGPVGNVDLGSASCPGGGRINVAASIADDLQRLLNAAAAEGVMLCGGGYRSSEAQKQARIRNGCPDVYNAPPSSCRTPTARPGQSMHERGLAVDFTCNGGGVISSRSSPCFQWLNSNAGSYGLRNLPSEPWHWSTNGN
jgi:LAS superfamily LD-carboxypeptidase LdcB